MAPSWSRQTTVIVLAPLLLSPWLLGSGSDALPKQATAEGGRRLLQKRARPLDIAHF